MKKQETANTAIVNDVVDPCLHALVDAAVDKGLLTEITQFLHTTFAQSGIYDLRFIDVNLAAGADIDAHTTEVPGFPGSVTTITLNTGALLNASQEYVTATIARSMAYGRL